MKYVKVFVIAFLAIVMLSCTKEDTEMDTFELQIESENEIATLAAVAACKGNKFNGDFPIEDLPGEGWGIGPALEDLGFDLTNNPVCEGNCHGDKTCTFIKVRSTQGSDIEPVSTDEFKGFKWKKGKGPGEKVAVKLYTVCKCK